MLVFSSFIHNFFFDTVYATFGWWFVTPCFPTYGVVSYGNWAIAHVTDYLTNWFLTQYSLLFYYSWLLATFYQIVIRRQPAYDQLLIRGVRYHNNFSAFFFLFAIHFFDFFFLMRSPSDFLFALQTDVLYLKIFFLLQILDMNFFMYATVLIIWHDYLDGAKLFGTDQVRNTRARNRQLREAVILNTFVSVATIATVVYCMAPEFWGEERPIDLWVTFIYRMPFYSDYVTDARYPSFAKFGSISDYTPRWYYPNNVRGGKTLMAWVLEKPKRLFKL